MKLDFAGQNFAKSNFMSIQWEPSCSMRAERQIDTTKLIVTFRNFANAPKNRAQELC